MTLPRVLCVDDEAQVLSSLRVTLRRTATVLTATSGAEGRDVLMTQGPFVAVLSDMQMPGMNGATFLSQVRHQAPDSVRMLLTGHADLHSAAAAINEGQIFRFLLKPCTPVHLINAFEQAIHQHHLLVAERVLLEQTLQGTIKVLTDVLALSNPEAFGRANRVRKHAATIAHALTYPAVWQLEVAAMVSQLGCISLTPAELERLYGGKPLAEQDASLARRLPDLARTLLGHIPRMEPVMELLQGIYQEASSHHDIPLGSRILRVALDYDALETQGHTHPLVIGFLRKRTGVYDLDILDQFDSAYGTAQIGEVIQSLLLRDVREGMIFAEDVLNSSGALLIAHGYEVTPSFIARLHNTKEQILNKKIKMIINR